MNLKSSRKVGHQSLEVMPDAKSKRFLSELANLRLVRGEAADTLKRIVTRYPEIFTGGANPAAFQDQAELALELRSLLGAAWDAEDIRHRDWYLHELENYYHRTR